MAEQIHIGFGIDKNFGRFAGITITSLVHNNIANELIIHIVYDDLLPTARGYGAAAKDGTAVP